MKNLSKKLISAFLVSSLLFSVIFIGIVNVVADSSILTNGGFEDGKTEPFVLNVVSGYASAELSSVANNGDYSLKFSNGATSASTFAGTHSNQRIYLPIKDLEKNTDYKLGFCMKQSVAGYVYTTVNSGSSFDSPSLLSSTKPVTETEAETKPYIAYNASHYNATNVFPINNSQTENWVKYTYTFNTGDSTEAYLNFFFTVGDKDEKDFYLDDFFIKSNKILPGFEDGGFESGEMGNISFKSAASNADTKVITEQKNTGSYSLKYKPSATDQNSIIFIPFNVEKNKKYEVSFFAKFTNNAYHKFYLNILKSKSWNDSVTAEINSDFTVAATSWYASTTQITNTVGSSLGVDSWKEIKITVNSGENTQLFVAIGTPYTYEIFFDDFGLKLVEEPKIGFSDGGFEKGVIGDVSFQNSSKNSETTVTAEQKYAGNYSLKYAPSATDTSGLMFVPITTEKNKKYVITFFAKFTNNSYHKMYLNLLRSKTWSDSFSVEIKSDFAVASASWYAATTAITNTVDGKLGNDEWKEIKISFNSGDSKQLYLGIATPYTYTIYFDDFSLSENTSGDTPGGDDPIVDSEFVVGSNNNPAYTSLINNTVEIGAKSDKVFHIFNHQTTMNTDMAYCMRMYQKFKVEAGKTYCWTFDAKIANIDASKNADGLVAYADVLSAFPGSSTGNILDKENTSKWYAASFRSANGTTAMSKAAEARNLLVQTDGSATTVEGDDSTRTVDNYFGGAIALPYKTGTKEYNTESTGWHTYSVSFTATVSGTVYPFIMPTYQLGSCGHLYVENWKIKEQTEAPKAKFKDASFEMQNEEALNFLNKKTNSYADSKFVKVSDAPDGDYVYKFVNSDADCSLTDLSQTIYKTSKVGKDKTYTVSFYAKFIGDYNPTVTRAFQVGAYITKPTTWLQNYMTGDYISYENSQPDKSKVLFVNNFGYGTNVIRIYETAENNGKWVKYSFTYNSGSNATLYFTMSNHFYYGTEFYTDNWTIEEVDSGDVTPPSNGTGNFKDYVLGSKVTQTASEITLNNPTVQSDAAGSFVYKPYNVETGKDYLITFKVRAKNIADKSASLIIGVDDTVPVVWSGIGLKYSKSVNSFVLSKYMSNINQNHMGSQSKLLTVTDTDTYEVNIIVNATADVIYPFIANSFTDNADFVSSLWDIKEYKREEKTLDENTVFSVDFEPLLEYAKNYSEGATWPIYKSSEHAHSGKYSIHIAPSKNENEGYPAFKFTNDKGAFVEYNQLKPNTTYKLSFWMYSIGDVVSDFRRIIVWSNFDSEKKSYFNEKTSEWQQQTLYFTTDDVNTNYCFFWALTATYLNKIECYIDDIKLAEASECIMESKPVKTYCEDYLNLIPNGNMEYYNTQNSWNVAGVKMTRTSDKNDDSISGNAYGKITGNADFTRTFDLKKGYVYLFSYSYRINKATNLQIGLVNSSGNPITADPESGKNYSSLLTPSVIGDWQREGFTFLSPADGKVSLRILGSNLDVDLDDIMLFDNYRAKKENPNINDYYAIDPSNENSLYNIIDNVIAVPRPDEEEEDDYSFDDYDDSEFTDDDDDTGTTTRKLLRIKKKKKVNNSDDSIDTATLVLIIVGCVLVLGAATTTTIILVKKKKKKA